MQDKNNRSIVYFHSMLSRKKLIQHTTLACLLSLFTCVWLTPIHAKTHEATSAAPKKITIFKVHKVSPKNRLSMRAYPSGKSRVIVKLPYNAKDITETGKTRIVQGARWAEVNWKGERGWVRAFYLKKTGVLLHANDSNNTPTKKQSPSPTEPLHDKPQEFGGDRYDQPVDESANETKSNNRNANGSATNKTTNNAANTATKSN